MIPEQDFLLKRIENKNTLRCAALLKEYAKTHKVEKGCSLYFLYNGDMEDDDNLLDSTVCLSNTAEKMIKIYKELSCYERRSVLSIYHGYDTIEVTGELQRVTTVFDIEQDNELFKVIRNEQEGCFDLILKKAAYDTSSELINIMSWLHQLGVNQPDCKIRIGAEVNSVIPDLPNKGAGKWNVN